jgi:hypothetical protein
VKLSVPYNSWFLSYCTSRSIWLGCKRVTVTFLVASSKASLIGWIGFCTNSRSLLKNNGVIYQSNGTISDNIGNCCVRRIQSSSERFDSADLFVRQCTMCLSWQWLPLFLAGVQHWEEFLQREIKSYPSFGHVSSCKVSGFRMCRSKHALLRQCTAYMQRNAQHGGKKLWIGSDNMNNSSYFWKDETGSVYSLLADRPYIFFTIS